VDAFLKSFGNPQVVWIDDVATIRLCRGLRSDQQVVDLVIDEVAVAS
jgi:hypothetical protein